MNSAPIILLDQVVQRRVVGPLATLAQRWLGVNKYHLLCLAEAFFFGMLVLIALLTFFLQFSVFSLFIQVFVIMSVAPGVPQRLHGLAELARRYERAAYVPMPLEFHSRALQIRMARPVMNVICILFVCLSCLFIAMPQILPEEEILDRARIMMFVSILVLAHLWDVDNIPPRDRRHRKQLVFQHG